LKTYSLYGSRVENRQIGQIWRDIVVYRSKPFNTISKDKRYKQLRIYVDRYKALWVCDDKKCYTAGEFDSSYTLIAEYSNFTLMLNI
jgi:hypothetical protein